MPPKVGFFSDIKLEADHSVDTAYGIINYQLKLTRDKASSLIIWTLSSW